MDCCKPNNDEDIKNEEMHEENSMGHMAEESTMQKTGSHGGCCGGGGMKMWIVMGLVFVLAWYFLK